MAVIFPCGQCEGRSHITSPSGQPQDCPRCNGRGWLESTEVTPEEHRAWWGKQVEVGHVNGGKGE